METGKDVEQEQPQSETPDVYYLALIAAAIEGGTDEQILDALKMSHSHHEKKRMMKEHGEFMENIDALRKEQRSAGTNRASS